MNGLATRDALMYWLTSSGVKDVVRITIDPETFYDGVAQVEHFIRDPNGDIVVNWSAKEAVTRTSVVRFVPPETTDDIAACYR